MPFGLTAATLQFSRYINNDTNHTGPFASPDSLNFVGAANQQAHVDILPETAYAFGTTANDVLMNVFQTNPGDPLVSGYTVQTEDVTNLLESTEGQLLTLRFAEVDNQGLLYFGVDQVSLIATVTLPELSTFALAALGLAAVAAWRLRLR